MQINTFVESVIDSFNLGMKYYKDRCIDQALLEEGETGCKFAYSISVSRETIEDCESSERTIRIISQTLIFYATVISSAYLLLGVRDGVLPKYRIFWELCDWIDYDRDLLKITIRARLHGWPGEIAKEVELALPKSVLEMEPAPVIWWTH